MTVFGNVCVALAFLVYLYPLQAMLRETVRHGPDGGGSVWGAILGFVPLWLLLTVALCIVTARGGVDWLARDRVVQFVLVLTASVALMVVTIMSMALRGEPASQTPWAVRPCLGWAAHVFPLVTMAFCLAALNPGIVAAVPAPACRVPMLLVGGLALLACAGMAVQWAGSISQREAEQIDRIVATENERDRSVMADVQRLDPIRDLGRLLNQTGLYETEAIRALALRKARSHPRFNEELATMLTNEWCGEALTFLEANDPPDAAALAAPARESFLRVAARIRDQIKNAHHLYADSFDSDVRRVLAVADKFRGLGVDYAPAIRELRAAFDEPRNQKLDYGCRRALDQWLAKAKGK